MVFASALYLTGCSSKVTVDACYDVGEVVVPVGELLAVRLESNPATGFNWELVEIGNQHVLEFVESEYEAGEGAKQNPPLPGSGGVEKWGFRALKKGQSSIAMEYSRPWEGG